MSKRDHNFTINRLKSQKFPIIKYPNCNKTYQRKCKLISNYYYCGNF